MEQEHYGAGVGSICVLRQSWALAGACAACLVSGVAFAAQFGPYQTFPAGLNSWPESVVIGDINGDGRNDVVMVTGLPDPYQPSSADLSAYIFLQSAAGTLTTPLRIAYSSLEDAGNINIGWRNHTGVAAGDLNGDLVDDIVVGRRKGIAVIWGNKQGSFSLDQFANTTGASSGDAILIMDVNRDGRPDIVSHNDTSGDARYGLTVYFGDGSGLFPSQRYMSTMSEGGVELKNGDLNGDGNVDLALSWEQANNNGVQVLYANDSGWFTAGPYLPKPEELTFTTTVAVGDVAGFDGRDDLVLGGGDFDGGKLYLFKQTAEGKLSGPTALPTTSPVDTAHGPDAVLAYDVDGNQRVDLLQLRQGGGIGYLEQRNAQPSQEVLVQGPYMSWGGNQPIAAGDLTGDGCTDVVVANNNYGLVLWAGSNCAIARNGSTPLTFRLTNTVGSASYGAGKQATGLAPADIGQYLGPVAEPKSGEVQQFGQNSVLRWLAFLFCFAAFGYLVRLRWP